MKTLREIRKEAGISQDILAARLAEKRGCKAYQGPISAMERGASSPTVKRLADYLEALGYSLRVQAVRVPASSEGGGQGEISELLDLESLMGKLPRAKDTRVKDTREEIETLIEKKELPIAPDNILTEQDPLESLILGILKK